MDEEVALTGRGLMAAIESSGSLLVTAGLGGADLELMVSEDSFDSGRQLLQRVIDQVKSSELLLNIGGSFFHGYWPLKLAEGSQGRLSIWEYSADMSRMVKGARLAMSYWDSQQEISSRFKARFSPPRPDQMAAVSPDVYEGEAVQGVRYVHPDHMSGWFLTTANFDGRIESLMVEHLWHVTASRPDLARFIALPPGFRFDTTSGVDVWFDGQVAERFSDESG